MCITVGKLNACLLPNVELNIILKELFGKLLSYYSATMQSVMVEL